MRVAALVVAWNGECWIEGCLKSLVKQDPRPLVVVIDNGSVDGTPEKIASFFASPAGVGLDVRIETLGANLGFPAGVNRGLDVVNDLPGGVEFVLLVNQDVLLDERCLGALVEAARQHPRAGALGARTVYPDSETIQHAGGYLVSPRMVGLHYGHHELDAPGVHNELREVDFVTGAAMMLRTSALAEAGPFNEAFSPGYYEDVELCARLRGAGWSVLVVPSARAFHAESSSFSDRDTRLRLAHRNRYLFLLPRLADVAFRDEFVAAEAAFLRDEAHFDELRAIRSAALDAQSRLGGLIEKRLAGQPCPPDLADAASAVLEWLAEASADELLARVRQVRSPSPGATR